MNPTRIHRRAAGRRLGATVIAVVLLGSVAVAGVSGAQSDLNAARAATARFNDLGQAAAAGYGQPPAGVPLHECIASFDGAGAMGFHYINGGLLDTTVDPTRPEVLVYAPDRQGKLKLVALEYVVFQAPWIAEHGNEMPSLFGQMFMATGEPNRFDIPAFFSLHVWLWKDNPAGMVAPFNPNVSCGNATASVGGSAQAASAVGAIAEEARWACRTSSRPAMTD